MRLNEQGKKINDKFERCRSKDITRSLEQQSPTQEPIHRAEQRLESSSTGNSVGSLFDMPILINGDDPEEEMLRRRMQRKKKKEGRM